MAQDVEKIPITFDEKFINDYARRLVKDPEVAIVELVSNCSDAGANHVKIDWPDGQFGDFTISDDGTGMTYDEFINIWNTLSYNRRQHGRDIEFPLGNTDSKRKLFGKNGKGRFSLFCFNNKYTVDTTKGGERCLFQVRRQPGRRAEPIVIELLERVDAPEDSHQTIISCEAFYKYILVDRLKKLIGCKFLADPSLKISVNGEEIALVSLEGADVESVETPLGPIEIFTLDSGRGGRTSGPHGVAWHVIGKCVGNIDWRDPNRLYTLDARTREAKRFTFIVVANFLEEFVNSEWTGFEDCDEIDQILEIVSRHIQGKLDDLFYQKRQERKATALRQNHSELKKLPKSSNTRIEKYVDGIQTEIRTIDQRTLNAVVKFLTTLEASSTGYELLFQLAEVQPDDVDRLYEILRHWSIRDAEIVLQELGRRLNLIEKLQDLVDEDVDELHIIHPLIEQGLWIFGPEYEGVSYISNKGLRRVFRELLDDDKTFLDAPRIRPDIVSLTDVFSRDSYGEDGEVNGLEKVLILELKRGGSEVKESEMKDLEKYALEIDKSGNLAPTGKIVGYLLGSTLGQYTDYPLTRGRDDRIRIEARTYQTVIRQAHARTFHLQQKIREAKDEAT